MVNAVVRLADWSRARLVSGWRLLVHRCRPWKPVVLVDARRARARRLRGLLSRAARAQFRGLGVPPPAHLLVVVQRTVHEERPLTALLQVFEDADSPRRHVLFIALTVDGEPVSDGEVLATLRQQLHRVVGDALGSLALTVPVGPPRARPATVVPLRAVDEPPFDDAPPVEDDEWRRIDGGAYPVAAER
jgi:hypothetical protein